MPPKKRWLFFFLCLLLAAVGTVCLGPFVIAKGLRSWLMWKARQQGCELSLGQIEAPLGRPILIHTLHLTSGTNAAFRTTLDIANAEADVNLASFFHQSRARLLRHLSADGVRFVAARTEPSPARPAEFDWGNLQELVADRFEISGSEWRIENGATVVALNAFALSASELEAGNFTSRELDVTTPWFHKSFPQLRGATSWQESRLTIGALSLMRGLDIESMSADLGHLAERRVSLQTTVDAFGGKLRATISSEDHADHRTWDVAGTASEVSLAQLSDGLEFADRASGVLHASKFTFRGNGHDLANATASVWAEISGLTWRDRTADTIMIGASLYNRAVQVEQLYVKQRQNQLTVSGESALPQKSADWLNPDFRGDISASINDLGDFARLFGANPPDFAGEISVYGSVNAQNRRLGGRLIVEGTELRIFGAAAGSWKARVSVKGSQLEIEQCELRRDRDFFQARGRVDLGAPHKYSATCSSSISNIANYRALVPSAWKLANPNGGLTMDWTAAGNEEAHRGTFHILGAGLHSDAAAWLLPLEADLEGDYTPENIFFRQFQLQNEHALFTAFVTIAENYLQLQALRFEVNEKPIVEGNVFLPFSFSRARANGDWLAALGPEPVFDVGLTIRKTDLAEVAAALSNASTISGSVDGSLELYGAIGALTGGSNLHLQNFSFNDPARLSCELEARAALGMLTLKSAALASGSDPLRLEFSLPFQFNKLETGYSLATDGSVAAMLDFPAIFLGKLPRCFSGGFVQDGILSGKLSLSESLRHPSVTGDLQLVDGKFAGGNRASARLSFAGPKATIDFANLTSGNTSQSARGEIDFDGVEDLAIKLFPARPLSFAAFPWAIECVGDIRLTSAGKGPAVMINSLDFHGGLFSGNWTVSLHASDGTPPSGPADGVRMFRFCKEGETLRLQVAPY